ncbi:MAG: arylsulfatase [Phycisphaerae bacterium]|nr:arylsulfatase [Phycisphaerae bacterium]
MEKTRPPNVILVVTDDQGYGDLSCHGNPILRTPNLDALRRQSARLTDFHASPTCAPTRASLMTGRYCNRTGVWHTIMGRSLLRRDEVTMADIFAARDYRTGIFGKWHLGDNFPFRPHDRGFHEVLVHGGGGVGQTPDFWGNDYFDDTYWHNGVPEKHSGYCTDVWFDAAMRFVEANRDRPFFVYLAPNAPHSPYNVPTAYSAPYGGPEVPNAAFYGMIANLDENMGRLMERLKSLDLEANTIVVFMTDNGTAAGLQGGKGFNAAMRGTKGSEYDGGHRVPCFIRWPAGELGGGRDVNRLTAHIDLLPTLIDLCGLPSPVGVAFDGASILPLLRGREAGWPDRVLVTDSQRIEHPQKWRRSAVMTDRWRLVNGKELYDIGADPGQRNDVSETCAETVHELRGAYERWWADISSRFDECCEIVVGSDLENPSRLTCHDWHEADPLPWNQAHIRQGIASNGFWAIEIARAGEYEFALRRWPREVDEPIEGAIPGGEAIRATKARILVGGVDLEKDIPEGAREVVFRIPLEPGKVRVQTWLTAEDGASRGAYYLYVARAGR